MLFFSHEESALEDIASLCACDLGMRCQCGNQRSHCRVVGVVDFDRLSEFLVVKLKAGRLFKAPDHVLIAGLCECVAESGLSVLGIGHGDKGDALNRVFPVLSDNFKGIAQAGDHDCGRSVVYALDSQLDNALHDRADKCREVFFGLVDLNVCSPYAHGNHPHRMDDLFGCIDRSRQNYLAAFCQIFVHQLPGVCNRLMEACE